MPDLRLERRLGGRVAGVDEAGRGPVAGPGVAAAGVLPRPLPAARARGLD
ncbi:MAG: ribonuclease HII, partial [Kiloniellales bacterium]